MTGGLIERSRTDRRVETNLSPHEHLLARKGDLAYNMMRMWQGVSGCARCDCLVSPAYVVLAPTDFIEFEFAGYLFKFDESIAKFRQMSQGVVDDRLRLYYRDLQPASGYAYQPRPRSKSRSPVFCRHWTT
jgi:type I restriction enzyme, S subunit